jgi:lipopolysaccharide/colanic/teichoic acid biosynthesis glycosyltransferase
MTISILPAFHHQYAVPDKQLNTHSQYCTLQWRRSQLLVKSPGKLKQPYFPSLNNPELLVECLKHSLVSLVSIDPALDEANLRFWAEACQQANKPIFLNLSSDHQLAQPSNQFVRILQRLLDVILATTLLLLFSPIILAIVIIMQVNSPGFLFEFEWYVGKKCRLFRAIKFCTNRNNKILPLGLLLHKYKVEHLLKLINVLRGEISLFGFRCWCLTDVLKTNLLEQIHLDKVSV